MDVSPIAVGNDNNNMGVKNNKNDIVDDSLDGNNNWDMSNTLDTESPDDDDASPSSSSTNTNGVGKSTDAVQPLKEKASPKTSGGDDDADKVDKPAHADQPSEEKASTKTEEKASTNAPDDDEGAQPPSSKKAAVPKSKITTTITSTTTSTTLPEPPRWRFVNVAKKSLGYSSVHAGSYIRGQTSNELGAEYVAPDFSLYKSKEDMIGEVKKLELGIPSNKSFSKDAIEVGKLVGTVPPPNAFSSHGNEVGKLGVRDKSSIDKQAISGKFAGLPKAGSATNESRKSFKEWETNIKLTPKQERTSEWYDGDINGSYQMPGNESQSKTHREVGRITFHGSGDAEECFVEDIAKSNQDHDGDDEKDNVNETDEYGDAREGALFIHNSGSADDAIEKVTSDVSTNTTASKDQLVDEEDLKKKRRCLYILLLVPLLLGVVIMGVVMGKDDSGDDERAVIAGAVGGLLIPPIFVLNETSVPSLYPSSSSNIEQSTQPSIEHSLQPSIEQSLQPSLSPSMECPLGTELFSIEHPNKSDQYFNAAGINRATWRIKDICSGEMIDQCLPCSVEGFKSQTQNNNGPTRHLEEKFLKKSRCLPVNNEYVLEVLPPVDLNECCGFDPATAVMTYNSVVVKDMTSDSIFADDSSSNHAVYFGERELPCPSKTPSSSPTCSKTDQEFNLCIAIDMSGSVCNDDTGSECTRCRAAFLPMFFDSECRDRSVSEDTCCENFGIVKEFSSLMVNSLGDFPAEKSFSVVQFATNAQLAGGLASAEQALTVIDRLDYTGGLTNHASAIQMCQGMLPSSGDRKNFIMLITDGISSEPFLDPEGEAENAATSAKSDGTFIIPIFISPYANDWSALAFMSRLSSDGKVFDVTDFESLDGLQDRLVDQVSCS